MNLSQIELHRNGVLVANYPLQQRGELKWVNIFGCNLPWYVKQEINKFVNGEGHTTRHGEYSWNWKKVA